MPPSLTSVTVPVTTWFLRSAPPPAPAFSIGSLPELLDAERDAFLLDIDVQHLGLDHLALFIGLDRFFAGLGPGQVGQMHHAVDILVQADEQAELGDRLDLAFDDGCRPDGGR